MILTGQSILEAIESKKISISPFHKDSLRSTSYDLHLSKYFTCYTNEILDTKAENPIYNFIIPEEGYILQPNKLYLARTMEYIYSDHYLPFLQGKSGLARLGISVHLTAPKGDLNYANFWTLEIVVIHPVKVYPEMPIAQILFLNVLGNKEYDEKQTYINEKNRTYLYPIPSKFYTHF